LSTADILALSKAADYDWQNILINNIAKISDLNVTNTVVIAAKLQESAKDRFVDAFIAKQQSLSTADFLTLSKAADYDWQNILVNSLSKTNDLSVANAIQIADRLQESAKDTYLMAAVAVVPDLNATNLVEMAKHGDYSDQDIIAKGKKRLGIP
jgi:hypothetical protein